MKEIKKGLCFFLAALLGVHFSLLNPMAMKAEESNGIEDMGEDYDEELYASVDMQTDEVSLDVKDSVMEPEREFSEVENTGVELTESSMVSVKGDEVSGFWQYSVDSNNEVTIEKYTGAEANVSVPSTIAGKIVKYLGEDAFRGNTWIVSVNIPDTVTSVSGSKIGFFSFGCFYECTNLTVVSGMKNVTSIGAGAFSGCSNLTTISFGSSLAEIGEDAFESCKKLTNCTFPASLTKLGDGCFEDTGLISVSLFLPNVEIIGSDAFCNCSQLETVSIGANISIGSSAFSGCSSLKNISIAAGSRRISIERYAFSRCTSLASVSLPENVRYIEEGAFKDCTSLQSVNFSFGLLGIGVVAFSNTALNYVVIPNSVINIFYRAFDKCPLSAILVPNSVTGIDNGLCNSDAIIQCYPGSCAQSYATEHDYQISLLQPVASSSLSLSAPTVYMNVDDVIKIPYTIAPANTTDAIIWESSNTGIATVNGIGEVTAKGVGSATVIATTTSGVRASVNVVVANKPTSVSFKKSRVEILVGKSASQKAKIEDDDGIRNDVVPIYTSSNSNIATVNGKGKVTGIKEGTVTITARTGALSATYKVKVVMAKISKKNKTLTIKTVPKAKIKVKAKKKILGSSSKKTKANKKGVAKIKFKRGIKGVTVKIIITKSGYKKKTITKRYK